LRALQTTAPGRQMPKVGLGSRGVDLMQMDLG
jgi:hypothetical protein